MKWLTYEVSIPTWALFLALLVVSAVAVWITSPSTAEALAHKAIDAGVIR